MKGETGLAGAKTGAAASPPQVSGQSLFAGKREVIIDHEGERYRLRITASNKLILIK